MTDFRAAHAEHVHAIVVPLPIAQAFPFFEPEGERAWAEGWNPNYLNPTDGRTIRGMVFTTDHGGEDTVWMMVRHEPPSLVEYVRVTPGSRIGRVLVQCSALDASRTRVNVVYALTGLTEKGNAMIRDLTPADFARFIDSWSESIGRVLSRKAGPT
jgi:hypothetical protein